MSAGPYSLVLFIFASAGASPIWSTCAWVTNSKSTGPIAERSDLYIGGVLGPPVIQGSIKITFPLGVLIRKPAYPSQRISVLP